MRLQFLITIAFALMPLLVQSQALKTYRWKNRILLLSEKDAKLSSSKAQIAKFSGMSEEVEDRQLIFLLYDGKVLRDKNLNVLSREKVRLPADDFQGVLLIGKDGGIKFQSGFYVTPKTIFEIIDSMPMRRAEMNRKHD